MIAYQASPNHSLNHARFVHALPQNEPIEICRGSCINIPYRRHRRHHHHQHHHHYQQQQQERVMSPPSYWQMLRQVVGRAFRETGQSLHRVALKTEMVAVTKHEYYDDYVLFEDFLSRHRQLFPLLTSGRPILHHQIGFVAPCATLIGTVNVGPRSSIWYGAILRGDYGQNVESFSQEGTTASPSTGGMIAERGKDDNNDKLSAEHLAAEEQRDPKHGGGGIFIGNDTNVQDGCVITARSQPTIIGNGVTIGHLAQLHSCTVHDYCLIGMGSIIQPGVIVETECLIGAGSVVPANTIVGRGELWLGNPARKIRMLKDTEITRLHYQSAEYVKVAASHQPIMELGGNVDAAGSSVYVMTEVKEEDATPLPSPLEETEPLFRALNQASPANNHAIAATTTAPQQQQRKNRGYMPISAAEMARREQQELEKSGLLRPRRLVRNKMPIEP
jgi:carbonic anhydrase/acetyltransferase-like protein (isoleucine patch superfamily)